VEKPFYEAAAFGEEPVTHCPKVTTE